MASYKAMINFGKDERERSSFDDRNAVQMWQWKAYLGGLIVLYYDVCGLPHRPLN